MKPDNYWKTAMAGLGALTLGFTSLAQDLTTPCPNRVISWNANNGTHGTIASTDLAGLAPATNWVDMSLSGDLRTALPDNTGNATTMDVGLSYFNISAIPWPVATDPGLDANGTANKRMLNVYLNAGPAGWNPPVTNVTVSLTNVPFSRYDVVVYFDADASGRRATIDNGLGTTYNFSTIGTGFRTGPNALFVPTTETNSGVFPVADFAFFPGMTLPDATFTETPKSGLEQWLGITAFQVIESSNVYVLYGPAPATQVVPVGQPASFSVMAGGMDPQFQWRHNGTDIPDATNATYSIAATTDGQNGSYEVVVTNNFSSVTSLVATLMFYAPKDLEWNGTGSTWDTSSTYWNANGSPAIYTETDNVRFGPAGSAQPIVTLSDTHTPSSIVISNASYTFMSGGLSGPGSLHLKNNATFILDTGDGRTGPTVIDSGCTFQLGNGNTAGSMGSGALTNNGALVFNAAGDEAYGHPIYGTGNITNLGPSGQITLGGTLNANYLVQAGSGTLLLQGDNNLVGGTEISAGIVLARNPGCLGGAPVLVTGGELQLQFTFDYVASPLTLAGGTLHGASQIWNGPVTLTADSTITVDGGNSLTLSDAAGLSGSGYFLTKSGAGALLLPGANNTFGTLNIGGGTVQIGTGGAIGGLTADTIQTDGALAFNLSSDVAVTNQITGLGAIEQLGSGTLSLEADLSAGGFSGFLTASNGTLLVNGTSGYGLASAAGGRLGGTGVFDAAVSVQAGGTLSPGASIGTMTLNNVLEFAGGDMLVEVNKSLSQSNDLVVVQSGFGYVTAPGVVTVNNLGPALEVGDKFQLFSEPITSGDLLSVVGGGATWTNNLAVDGTIEVLSVVAISEPTITGVSFASPTELVLAGTNGTPGMPFQVLSTTNVALPVTQWTLETSGSFGGDGTFSVTNTVSPDEPQKFYLLQQ